MLENLGSAKRSLFFWIEILISLFFVPITYKYKHNIRAKAFKLYNIEGNLLFKKTTLTKIG